MNFLVVGDEMLRFKVYFQSYMNTKNKNTKLSNNIKLRETFQLIPFKNNPIRKYSEKYLP